MRLFRVCGVRSGAMSGFPKLLKIAGVVVFALVAGIGSAWWSILGAMSATGIQNGAWYTSTAIGSQASDPYMRAQIALTGLLALTKAEAIYFTATEDDDGNALSGNCTYEVTGRSFAARWWSLTAYGDDHFLIDNPADRYSYNVASLGLRFAPLAKWQLTVSAEPREMNWLPVDNGSFFSLTLRLYNPSPDIVADPSAVRLPSIRKIACTPEAEGAAEGTTETEAAS